VSKIEIGRWAELLKRMSGIAGAESVSGDLSPEVSPVMVLEDLADADYLFLKSARLCSGATAITGAVGFASRFRLRNPVLSGVIAVVNVVELVQDAGAAAADLTITVDEVTTDLSFLILTTVPDSRWEKLAGFNQTALQFSVDNTTVLGPQGDPLVLTRTPGNTPYRYPYQVPLLPGSAIEWGSAQQNLNLRGWVRWIERGLPALER